jgi:O-antigen ligase
MYLLNNYYLDINGKSFLGLIMERSKWTQKNYMFWYVLFMWGTISFFDIKKSKEFLIVVSILIISFYVLKHGYSKSALLAFFSGSVIYIIISFFNFSKKILLSFVSLFTAYIIFSPIIFSFVDLTNFHPRLRQRMQIYHTSVILIKNKLLTGYGFGSTLKLNLNDIVDTSKITISYINHMPGGHPHNLSLLFWIEYGIIGAIFLAFFIHRLFSTYINNNYATKHLAAALAMILSMDIITSFSWSIWYPQVLLTYSFFVSLLLLSSRLNYENEIS